jgi:HAD superfamily hydrolase (TIGR01509 family)
VNVEAPRAAGSRCAVVSASKNRRKVLAVVGTEHLVEARVDGILAELAGLHGKPAPDMFPAAAAAREVAPVQSAVFEDALAGVAAGRAGAFGQVVGVGQVGQAEALRHHGADQIVGDLSELLEEP